MPFDPTVLIEADDAQKQAAHDSSPQVRVIAGPGTGKSFTIEERVAWLLQAKGIDANAIIAVSFTRASARDLKLRIYEACRNIPNIEKVRVGTLHSLGLTVLKKAGQLTQYPSSPMVLSDWETENIFDVEFRNLFGYGKKRAAMIRKFREAFWFSGEENPSSYVAPDPAVSDAELSAFISFHGPRTQVYSCVLPGEIVQQCVEKAETGLLDVVGHAGCAHLIVDEFQDLNPMDLRFIELFIESSVPVFVAGDDDQSVYSFRYASPDGLQDFCAEHSGSGDHELRHCFRCATSILKCATTLIERNGGTSRVPKHPLSVYSSSSPQIEGTLKLLKFPSGKNEEAEIAHACAGLIGAGMIPNEILILTSNKKGQLPGLLKSLSEAGVEVDARTGEDLCTTKVGQMIIAILKIACNKEDYVAHRILLGAGLGVGASTVSKIAVFCETNTKNYLQLFYSPLPTSGLGGREVSALLKARIVTSEIKLWADEDVFEMRKAEIEVLINQALEDSGDALFAPLTKVLPIGVTLREVLSYLQAETDEQRSELKNAFVKRLGEDALETPSPKVRVMSMHGAKGLSASVVFIPGLEDDWLPGPHRSSYPRLLSEAARLLYVAITRARVACVISLADRRVIHGQSELRIPSRLASDFGLPFVRAVGNIFSQSEILRVIKDNIDRKME